MHRFFVLALLLTVGVDGTVAVRDSSRVMIGAVQTYTTVRGDSFVSVGARFGIDAGVLAQDNGMRAGSVLPAGQVLQVDNRHLVPPAAGDGIVINLPQRMLFLFVDGRVVAGYPVAVGRASWPSPLGTYEIGIKEVDPTWDVPISIQQEMARSGKRVLTAVPPGPENPLGDRWLGLKGIGVGIHGTNVASSVFRFTTHGCFRLHPDDVRALFDRVEVGTPVHIVYEPVLVAIDEAGRVWIEVHRDAYRRAGDLEQAALDLVRKAGLADRVDAREVERCVRERRGRPCAPAGRTS